ncbi:MAG: hypothetical protein A3F17_08585 [Gammaproteobacteria bacterium RIFCSPHIGHO2_12_FULL_41_15]|nr:MAG: hypothetical protein A3F17_08585 [Gammaproteobacteria bacterium RIFCSPHIGHO2_12_FULL_41_15]
MFKKYRVVTLLLLLLAYSEWIFACHVKFFANIHDGFVRGQFSCVEINQYGDMSYACGGRNSDGSIRNLSAQQIIDLPDHFFDPYHNPKKIQIKTVYIQMFTGEIQRTGEQIVSCQFPADRLTRKSTACIVLQDNGTCTIQSQC